MSKSNVQMTKLNEQDIADSPVRKQKVTDATMKISFWKQPFWKIHMYFLCIICPFGIGWLLKQTYGGAAPMATFENQHGIPIITKQMILEGQYVFQKYGLMQYGSFFGDGAQRGPDFTAEALHQIALSMTQYYTSKLVPDVKERVIQEIKKNTLDKSEMFIQINNAQVQAFNELKEYYRLKFTQISTHQEAFIPNKYIKLASESENLAAFFFWGAWVCGVQRPGQEYSYTHNWPYDPIAGNVLTKEAQIWSTVANFGMLCLLGKLLYAFLRRSKFSDRSTSGLACITEKNRLNPQAYTPSFSQSATGKFIVVACILFFLQTVCGLIVLGDFLGKYLHVDLPVTVTRSYHLQFAVQWIVTSWIAASIFTIPMITGSEPLHQTRIVNVIFTLLVIAVVGTIVGIFLGTKDVFGQYYYLFGHQGWEYLELGKFFHFLMFLSLVLWAFMIWRGLRNSKEKLPVFSIPKWIQYAVIAIVVLFAQGFIARPSTSFIIADMWRWMVIHMYVECFFEVFSTVIIGYFMVMMGLLDMKSAERSVNVAVVMFLGSGVLGISHNLYWLAKPEATLAIGAVFSTLQVVPLIMITVSVHQYNKNHITQSDMNEPYLYLVAVNFWNFFGAGVFGYIINLPSINYYVHGTYLCVNHAHGALFGVYGNLSICAILFVAKHLSLKWNPKLIKFSFWCLQIGLILMIILDLLPAGIIQLNATMDKGLHFSRSQKFIKGEQFQFLQALRILGGLIFSFGGSLPLAFAITRAYFNLKKPTGHQTFHQTYFDILDRQDMSQALEHAQQGELSLKEVAQHNSPTDLWVVVNGVVCDVTNFQETHPGGADMLMMYAGGVDCDEQWNKIHEKNIILKCQPEVKIMGVIKEHAKNKKSQQFSSQQQSQQALDESQVMMTTESSRVDGEQVTFYK